MLKLLPRRHSLLLGEWCPSCPSMVRRRHTADSSYASLHWDDTVTTSHANVQRLHALLKTGSRAALAESITLVESTNAHRRAQGEALLALVHRETRADVFRVGISGSPGVGKSTFIECLGMKLVTEHHRRLAVLTVDPSSHTSTAQRVCAWQKGRSATGGSILGDLTRMETLARHPNAFVRQSPSAGSLGGVTRGTHEAIALCEAAGYDLVFIETVGVGQSEATVADMCDMFMLLLSPAHGDELQVYRPPPTISQGIKRGIVEAADLLVVTKADGQLASQAKLTQAEYMSALKYMRPRAPGVWRPRVMRASSMTGEGIDSVWTTMEEYWRAIDASGHLHERRLEQASTCMLQHVQDGLLRLFATHPNVAGRLEEVQRRLDDRQLTAGQAADALLRAFLKV